MNDAFTLFFDIMKNILTKVFIACMLMGALGAMLYFRGKGDSGPESPETVVTEFNKAMASGDIAAATALCDTVSMKDYMDRWKQTWERLEKEDSSAMAIASGILSEASVEVSRVEKAENGKAVYYKVMMGDMEKERMAMVRKNEEGAWKVTAITDVI